MSISAISSASACRSSDAGNGRTWNPFIGGNPQHSLPKTVKPALIFLTALDLVSLAPLHAAEGPADPKTAKTSSADFSEKP